VRTDERESPRAARLTLDPGSRTHTPIGPIRADLAYGEKAGEFRLHFSMGYTV
jgi:hypothetical protein